MRILIHTQFYPPEMGAPQARLSDLAKRLVQLGHTVEVLTAMPNYPTGRVFTGYGGFYRKETLDGIGVHRSWMIPSKKPSMAHRLMSYLSFSKSSFVVGLLKIGKVDIIITESPPLFLAISGWLLASLKGARWIMNVSDLWPDSAKYIGMLSEDNLIYRMMAGLAHVFYRRASLVTGQSREIIEEIKRQVPSAKTYHLSNGVDTTLFHPGQRKEEVRKRYLKDGEIGFVFAGLHGLFQGLDQIIYTAEQVKDEKIRFVLLGDGTEKESLMKTVREAGMTNVDFYPPVSHKDMPSILSSMDVALITLRSVICGAVPSKIYEAMASGIPILLVAEGEARDIVLGAHAGISVSPGDREGLVHAVRELASDSRKCKLMGKSGHMASVDQYDRARIAEKFEAVIRQL